MNEKNTFYKLIEDFGWPRIIIFCFVAALFAASPFVGVDVVACFSDVCIRFTQNAVLVLAMLPMIQSGAGLNFGLPTGIIAGLLGATIAMQTGVGGATGFALAILISLPFALVFGLGYGIVLNKVKGEEMTIAMYVGFSAVTFMSILWLALPFTNPTMVWAYAGQGLRTTISLEGYWSHILNNFLAIKAGTFVFPTGALLFFIICAVLMRFFMLSKTGTALTAVGSNPRFARAGGVSVDRMRIISVCVSTLFGAVGIIVYQQSFGFIQVYNAPLYMAFPAVAAILLGGASVQKATIFNVVIGTFLFQSILTMTPSVINSVVKTDMSEVIRILISNGMIVYALTRKTKVTK
ncbi:MAG: ABC transporter permease [Spirochaetaceae bacterium]|jgi:simple sugar transport system permease protein|nr:ABC transporter permease [Spirochaetaceae bacterium]